jgi:hypothetical protein
VKSPKNAIAASALTHAAETVAFMYVGFIVQVYAPGQRASGRPGESRVTA